MFRMILLNLDKKLSIISVIFMVISIFAIYIISIYNASFDLTEYELLNSYDLVVNNFLEESFNLIEIVSIVFVVLLVELELFYNNDNFDSYFISLKGKKYYFIVKVSSYLIIILFYVFVVFLGIAILYLVRFNDIVYLFYIFSSFLYYLIYLVFYFLIAMLFLLVFKNYFSAMLVFLYYWLGKMIDSENQFFLAICPKIYLNIEEKSISFSNVNIIYIILLTILLFIINKKIYEHKDLKLIS